jgi:hypothetical protein
MKNEFATGDSSDNSGMNLAQIPVAEEHVIPLDPGHTRALAEHWWNKLNTVLTSGSAAAITGLFAPVSHSRDLLAFTRSITPSEGAEAIARKVGPVWGIGSDGEMNNMWRRTPQEGLWFVGGSFSNCRTYSRHVALQIKAIEEGLLSKRANERFARSTGLQR